MRFWFVLALVVSGCGGESAGWGLVVRMPASLARSEARRERLEQRAPYLLVRLTTRAGYQQELRVAGVRSQTLALPKFAFPADSSDRLYVTVQVWDQTRERTPRVFAALAGSASVSAQEAARGPGLVVVSLALRVPISEYDL